ncbi:MAG: TonB-dependent receptor [Calditrichaeota bacterium]|nr:MAG: TonB-dependent receptor [Calditrichota bacterium]
MSSSRWTHLFALLGASLILAATFPGRAQEQQPSLPEIQSQEYTIIGLEKIVLPKKQRLHLTRSIALQWSDFNHRQAKQPVQSFFPFSRFKPVFLNQENYPVLRVFAGGGSFTTLEGGLFVQKRFPDASPFLDVRWGDSEGHTTHAGWTRFVSQGGVDVPLQAGGLLSVTGGFTLGQQELWAPRLVAWRRVRFDRQHLSGEVQWNQPWGRRWHTTVSLQGTNHLLKRVFRTEQTSLLSRAELQFRSGSLSVQGAGRYWQVTTDRQRPLLPLDGQPVSPEKQTHRLWSCSLLAGGSTGILGLKLGILFQTLDPENGWRENRVFARAELSLQPAPQLNLFVRYRPGFDFLPLQTLLDEHRASDLTGYQPTEYKHRVTGGIDWQTPLGLRTRAAVSFLRADNYPALRQGLGTLVAADTLPLWLYTYLPEARLWRYSVQAGWSDRKRVDVHVLASYWKSRVNGLDEKAQPIRNRELPHLPDLTARAVVRLHLMGGSWVEASLHYAGRRFQDLANRRRLDGYVLLNARLHLALLPHLALRFYGENLTDRGYQLYSEYAAPGIAAGGRLMVTF